MLDGVLEVVLRHGHGQANPVLGQLLDRRLHAAIQPERLFAAAAAYVMLDRCDGS